MTIFSKARTLLLAVLAMLFMASCSDKATTFHTIDVTGKDYAQSFSMPDTSGKMRTLADFKGKIVYVFFGYAQCPDVCPTTMVEMAEVKKQLGKDADKLQLVFVTVDPERDTPEIMQAYITAFDPQGVALVGSLEQLAAMASEYKVFYRKVGGTGQNDYTMDHSAGGYIYDTTGKLRLYAKYGTPVDDLTSDIRKLLQGK